MNWRRLARYATLGTGAVLGSALALSYRSDRSPEELEERYANSDSSFVRVDGQRVHFRDSGQGPTLLLLHGIASSLHTWSGWEDRLRDSFRLVRPDLPGFGLTGPHPDEDYSPEAYLSFLEKFTDELGLDHYGLVGSSLGGRLALRHTIEHEDQVRKLVLLNPMSVERRRPSLFSLARLPLSERAFRFTPGVLVRTILSALYGESDTLSEESVRRYHELLLREGNRRALHRLLRDLDVPDETLLHSADQITVPTLIQWGLRDPLYSVDQAERLRTVLPNASLVTYLSAGHVPMEEIPEQTARDAASHLRS